MVCGRWKEEKREERKIEIEKTEEVLKGVAEKGPRQ